MKPRALLAVVLSAGLLAATGQAIGATVQAAPVVVRSASDLPRFSYPMAGAASALLEADDATFAAFAAQVGRDLQRTLKDYRIEDKSTMGELLRVQLNLQELSGARGEALKTIETLRALEQKPASRLMTGLTTQARLQAGLDAGAGRGAAFETAYRRRLGELVGKLPWPVVQDRVRGMFSSSRTMSRAAIVARAARELDPAAVQSRALDAGQAWDLLGARMALRATLPVADITGDVLHAYIASNETPKPDIWGAREVTLTSADALTPVNVAIWDSGIDVSLFPGQVFTDPKPTPSGTHGLAFNDVGGASTDWLFPISEADRAAYPWFQERIRGRLDLQNGVDSPAARAVQKRLKEMSPADMEEMFKHDEVLSHYVHGTHCAGIAVRGNPAARLVVARFNDQLPYLPFQPTEAWARQMGVAFAQLGEYFRSRNVRVVNLSWGDDAQEFETWLSRTGGGADPQVRKERARALFALWKQAVQNAIRSAPGTLFVVAAGNTDSDVGFIEDVPASLQEPNLLAVGAVDQAGAETSFTSHGAQVRVHADGFQVDSFVPGGARLRLSGTSMAAPQVVNLAAKLFALDPALTPAQVIRLIEEGATPAAGGRLHLIDPKASVALLKKQRQVR